MAAMDASIPMRAVGVSLGLMLMACSASEEVQREPAPVILIGIDGASWNAVKSLWEQGELPHLKALADEGVTAELKPVASESPVIWTSIATGVRPERHGITSFVVPTPEGDVPVSSRIRRVPAIWNMVSTVQRRVAALGWWASWPAESVNGIVVTDRVVRSLDEAIYPPEFRDTFDEITTKAENAATGASRSAIARQDRSLAAVATHLAGERFDLLMVYFRNVDAESHPNWKYFRPQDFPEVDPERLEQLGRRVPDAYVAVDRVIGELRAAAGPDCNLFVVSDHGFRAVKREQYRIGLDLDRVLEHLGYVHRLEGKIDWSRTSAATWGTAPGMRIKLLRFGLTDREPMGPIAAEDLAQQFKTGAHLRRGGRKGRRQIGPPPALQIDLSVLHRHPSGGALRRLGSAPSRADLDPVFQRAIGLLRQFTDFIGCHIAGNHHHRRSLAQFWYGRQ